MATDVDRKSSRLCHDFVVAALLERAVALRSGRLSITNIVNMHTLTNRNVMMEIFMSNMGGMVRLISSQGVRLL